MQIEDALPVRLGELEFQGVARFTKDTYNRSGSDLCNLSLVVKLGGPIKGLELIAGVPYATGNQSSANQGSGHFVALYQLNDNIAEVPALAVEAAYDTPYGSGHKTAEYTFKALATKYLGASEKAPRLHLNLIWTHRTQPGESTRTDQLAFGVAYSMLVQDDTAAVVDFVHGAKPESRQTENVVDVGLRHEISSSLAVSAGVGAGIAQQSPDYRFILAVQKSFAVF